MVNPRPWPRGVQECEGHPGKTRPCGSQASVSRWVGYGGGTSRGPNTDILIQISRWPDL